MGLFVAEDGRYQGWLAAFLCCFAAVTEDEYPNDERTALAPSPANRCIQQSLPSKPRPALAALHIPTAFKAESPLVDGNRHASHIPDRPPLLSPLDFGDSSPFRPWRPDISSPSPTVNIRPSAVISSNAPRRSDHPCSQRHALVPLRLGPVVLRDLPTIAPNAHIQSHMPESLRNRSGSTETLVAQYPNPQSPPQDRQSVLREHRQRVSTMLTQPRLDTTVRLTTRPSSEQSPSTGPSLSMRSSSSSLRCLSAVTPSSSVKSKSSSERIRPRKMRSFPSIRKDGTDRLEQEILELNTIVEERRAETARENPSDLHVAAVAPSMSIGARSETLDAIGSALSRPLTVYSEPAEPKTPHAIAPRWPVFQQTSNADSWSSSRLSGWLSGIFPSGPATRTSNVEPFYKCQTPRYLQRTPSEASTFTFLTELDSPSLTAASSPTTKGHSRNLTDESQLNPVSPIILPARARNRATSKSEREDPWPFVITPTTEVGMAL